MARRNISLPDGVDRRMGKFPDENWSSVCQQAIGDRLLQLELRSKKMLTATERANKRLKASKSAYEAEAEERGRDCGIEWAADSADYAELKRLADAQIDDFETTDALGPPGIFVKIIDPDNFVGRQSIEQFWGNLGYDLSDEDLYSAEFWCGFTAGALSVFEDSDLE